MQSVYFTIIHVFNKPEVSKNSWVFCLKSFTDCFVSIFCSFIKQNSRIAQSIAATGKSFAHYWMHCAHLMIEGEKMSKSLGNDYVLKDLLDKGYSTRALRYVLLTTHYRQPLNFTHEAVVSATRSIERLDTLYQAADMAKNGGNARNTLKEEIEKSRDDFTSALEDDLNISDAMAVLFRLVSSVHQVEMEEPLNKAEGVAIKVFSADVDRVLGFLIPQGEGIPKSIVDSVKKRIYLRGENKYEEADMVRSNLLEEGYQLEDMGNKTVVIWSGGRKIITMDDNKY